MLGTHARFYRLEAAIITTLTNTPRSGIIGLYTGYKLIESGIAGDQITVLAEFLPGDESAKYTSPYAGGNFSSISGDDPESLRFDKYTYQNLAKVQKTLGGPSCGLEMLQSTEIWDKLETDSKINSLKGYLKDYKEIPQKELPPGAKYGVTFTTWNFNCPKFLASLQNYLFSKGVRFERRKLSHIAQAFLPGAKCVFNCTGNGARFLDGVKDLKVYATRGQVVVIKAPHINENKLRWGDHYATYIIKRPNSNDQLVLGGYLQKDDWTPDTFGEQTQSILQRTTALFPEILLKNPLGPKISDLEILRVVAGLRPSRHGGVRIEKEVVEGKTLIHNYGAGGYGYQSGLGMADKAVKLALGRSKF